MSDPTDVQKVVEQYDEQARSLASFIHGQLAMVLYSEGVKKERLPGMIGDWVKIHDVEQGYDKDGNYLPWVTIVTDSGHRIRVTVEPE